MQKQIFDWVDSETHTPLNQLFSLENCMVGSTKDTVSNKTVRMFGKFGLCI